MPLIQPLCELLKIANKKRYSRIKWAQLYPEGSICIYFFFFSLCESSEPATDLVFAEVLLSFRTLLALLATLAEVTFAHLA